MNAVLDDILRTKKTEVSTAKKARPLEAVKDAITNVPPPRDFQSALAEHRTAIIAEIKKASPTKGILVHELDHRRIAQEYANGGASALSILTDREFFAGEGRFLNDVRSVTDLPLLRKDFIIDEYQIYESRFLGADAILLIVRILDERSLSSFRQTAESLGMAVVVEVHDENDVRIANKAGASIIGVNNRDLRDFSVSIQRAIRLRSLLRHDALAIAESGIRTADDIRTLRAAGYRAFLVGESLMMSPAKADMLRTLTSA